MLLKLLTLGGLGYAGYKYYEKQKADGNPAFAGNQPQRASAEVRDAGPESMRDQTKREWTKADEDQTSHFQRAIRPQITDLPCE